MFLEFPTQDWSPTELLPCHLVMSLLRMIRCWGGKKLQMWLNLYCEYRSRQGAWDLRLVNWSSCESKERRLAETWWEESISLERTNRAKYIFCEKSEKYERKSPINRAQKNRPKNLFLRGEIKREWPEAGREKSQPPSSFSLSILTCNLFIHLPIFNHFSLHEFAFEKLQ